MGPAARRAAAPAASADAAWEAAARRFLPRLGAGVWRSSDDDLGALPPQGWKLHVSATFANAGDVLRTIGPVLRRAGAPFKGPASLAEVKKLNCGLFYGYSQIGKIFTAYPRTPDEAVRLGRQLAEATCGLAGPAVPFERRVSAASPVFARYGAFGRVGGSAPDAASLEAPDGTLVADRRDEQPAWVHEPAGLFDPADADAGGPLASVFRAYAVVSQRGKGGVYQALDLSCRPARLCLLKEGRRHGETDVDGSDGRSRLDEEVRVLGLLRAAGIAVPAVYAHFTQGQHAYAVLEHIEGEPLDRRLAAVPLATEDAIALAIGVTAAVARLHAAGWVWRDLKPANLIVCATGTVRPVDFEGTARLHSRLSAPWGSPGYLPPGWLGLRRAATGQDRYALGCVLWQLFTGAAQPSAEAMRSLPTTMPRPVQGLVRRLSSPNPSDRPRASAVLRTLERL